MPARSPLDRYRRSIRLPDYDYSQSGAYFVTICTHQREVMLGDIMDGAMRLNACGEIVSAVWVAMPLAWPGHYAPVTLDAFIIMPNHVHVVFRIRDGYDLAAVVKPWKAVTTRRAKELLCCEGRFWMREYYDLWAAFSSGLGRKGRIKESVRRALIHRVDRYLLTRNVRRLFAQSKTIQDIASALGVRQQRFRQEHEDCILCGRCVRMCSAETGGRRHSPSTAGQPPWS